MRASAKQDRLRQILPITDLLKSERVAAWSNRYPQKLITECLRAATAALRRDLLENSAAEDPSLDRVLAVAEELLDRATSPRLRAAINATGIILHTGLGRAVFPAQVVDSMVAEMKGYCTLAIDRDTGERMERDKLVEELLVQLTGAEAATVVNNNAASTMLVLAALASAKEVLVSRGQLIEIGGSFRLPEVMAQSGAKLVEVGATNRTHLTDYVRAFTPETAAIMRVHPSNYRIVGFTAEPPLKELANLAHTRGTLLIDDLGAGALVPLESFGLPHEPTVNESIQAGADIVLFSGDKLIGASQSGIIIGRKELIAKLRKHPLMRAVRVDKTCLLVLERTLQLFRDPARLAETHPTYRMLSTPVPVLRARAESLCASLKSRVKNVICDVVDSCAFVGSGSLPTESIPSVAVALVASAQDPAEFARRLRMDPACVFGRIEDDRVLLDMRTVTGDQIASVLAAVERIISPSTLSSAVS
jgi:L-seryl-tRNA(Ser) seleniumtransferase